MKRINECRGLKVGTDEWVYGRLAHDNKIVVATEHYGLPYEKIDLQYYQVKPETIGRYIGTNDCNGRDVYEHDIVYRDQTICPILFINSAFRMITKENEDTNVATQERIRLFKVIGNIHQNPELIKKYNG